MENIIEELIHIEEQADLVMAQSMKDREDLKNRIRSATDDIKSMSDKQTLKTIEQLYEKARQDSQEKVRQLQEESQVGFSDMQSVFSEHHEQWEKEIYERIIGR